MLDLMKSGKAWRNMIGQIAWAKCCTLGEICKAHSFGFWLVSLHLRNRRPLSSWTGRHFSHAGPMICFRGERERESQRDGLPSASFSNTFSSFSICQGAIFWAIMSWIPSREGNVRDNRRKKGERRWDTRKKRWKEERTKWRIRKWRNLSPKRGPNSIGPAKKPGIKKREERWRLAYTKRSGRA